MQTALTSPIAALSYGGTNVVGRRMRNALISLAVLASASGHAATLRADSLICVSLVDLEFASRQEQLKGQPATAVISQAAALAFRLRALQELEQDAPTARNAEAARSDADAYEALSSRCAATAVETVTVLERNPVSGFAKVRLDRFPGRPEFWTTGARLSD